MAQDNKFPQPKGPRRYPTLKPGNKTAKTNPEKAQPFVESVERNFSIESHPLRKSHLDRINKFVEARPYHPHHQTQSTTVWQIPMMTAT